MDCRSNETCGRCDLPSNRRANNMRQNNYYSRQRMMGSYPNSHCCSDMNRLEQGCSKRAVESKEDCCSGFGRMKMECGCDAKRESKNCGCGCEGNCCDCEKKDRKCVMNAMRATECMPLGMAYIPYQEFESLYEWDKAFCQGTLFCDLDKPFLVTDCAQGGGRR